VEHHPREDTWVHIAMIKTLTFWFPGIIVFSYLFALTFVGFTQLESCSTSVGFTQLESCSTSENLFSIMLV
jgi:hypothetical protein